MSGHYATKPQFGFPIGPWFRAFAWIPTDTDDQGRVWLRRIWRRQCQSNSYLSGPIFNFFQSRVEKPSPIVNVVEA